MILQELFNNPAVNALLNNESTLGNLSITQEACILAAAYQKQPHKMMIVKNNSYTAQKLVEELTPLLQAKVLLFGVEESLRVEAIASSPEAKANQLEAMNDILNQNYDILITHTAGLIRYMPSVDVFKEHCLSVHVNQILKMEDLKFHLFNAGYEYVTRVDQPLTYAARGGIVDIYSMNHDNPIRIEFFDNEIESIRFFDTVTQRTLQTIDQVTIIPATDLLFSDEQIAELFDGINDRLTSALKTSAFPEELNETIQNDLDLIANHQNENHLYRYFSLLNKKSTISDYLSNTKIILSNIDEINDKIKHMHEETINYVQELVSLGKGLPTYTLFSNLESIRNHTIIEFQSYLDAKTHLSSGILELDVADLPLAKKLETCVKEAKHKRVLLCLANHELQIVRKMLDELTIKIEENSFPLSIGLHLFEKELVKGFSCEYEKMVVYTNKELFNTKKIISRYTNKYNKSEILTSYQQLQPGDYVVHQQHGVGLYNGIITRENEGIHKDYLQVIFKGDDQLLVPLEQFKLVRKFVSKEGAAPKLNKLGTKDWEKTKNKIKENVAELAQRLVALYSLREDNIGFAYSKDTEEQTIFENEFEFELTDDQKRAVIEIKHDMETPKPMDRLLCGDVGFGKTEVAIRAAFKAIQDGKQVAFLCPTTILSQQHYKVFLSRFKNYAVNIKVLNRFVSPSDQKNIVRDLKAGQIDVLIGTHRILSQDVLFKDLGFLIIDEEQRFGVQHKEKIKELKTSIDVLSLSATPIPRTLQMSLVGVRGLSQLDTPPLNRHSVQTYVLEKNPQMINDVIQMELAREGQVFYLYNNVKNIYSVANKIKKDLDIEVGVVHGQMDKESIEDVMLRFVEKEYKVLVCTTIIETGIDIPNANTIIIENADRFGLSQLYQIKGRVGRSDRVAYAYLFYEPQKQLTEIAAKRLKSIKEFTQLGSGYKIAMRDLTIRGAGDMLGPQQAGFIDTIGIDMYLEMLNDAILAEKGIVKKIAKVIKKSNLSIDAYIPKSFTEEDYEKITFYQQVDSITTLDELLKLMDEIQDNYGHLPKEVELLFEKKRLDILLNEAAIFSFKEYPKDVECVFTKEYSNTLDGVKLFEMVNSLSRSILLRYHQEKIHLRFPKQKDWLKMVVEVIQRSKEMIVD